MNPTSVATPYAGVSLEGLRCQHDAAEGAVECREATISPVPDNGNPAALRIRHRSLTRARTDTVVKDGPMDHWIIEENDGPEPSVTLGSFERCRPASPGRSGGPDSGAPPPSRPKPGLGTACPDGGRPLRGVGRWGVRRGAGRPSGRGESPVNWFGRSASTSRREAEGSARAVESRWGLAGAAPSPARRVQVSRGPGRNGPEFKEMIGLPADKVEERTQG